MKSELFTVQLQKDGRTDLNLAREHYFGLVEEVNTILSERNYSTSELYQILIYRGLVKPTLFREFEKFIRWGVRQGLIDPDKLISRTVKGRKLPNFFVKDQWVKFFKNCDDPRTAVTSFIAFWCGLRPSEVVRLKKSDLDFDENRLKIVQSKRDKDRIVPFLKEGHEVIKKWMKYSEVKEYLFYSDESHSAATENKPHISLTTMREGFRKALEKSGLDEKDTRYKGKRGKYTFYAWRHSFATYWINKGVSPAFIKEAMGHAKMDTTINVYSHIANDNIINEMNKLRLVKKPVVQSFEPQAEVEVKDIDSKKLIAERFVRGEITKDEAMSMKNDLMEIMG